VIVEELALSDEHKTIKPWRAPPDHIEGLAGGTKYFARGIFFKFAHEIQYLFADDSIAAKAAGHELRACNAVAMHALETGDTSLLPPL
jgi:hypothetical protein